MSCRKEIKRCFDHLRPITSKGAATLCAIRDS